MFCTERCVDIPGNSKKNISCPLHTEFQFKVGWFGRNDKMCEPEFKKITEKTKAGFLKINKTVFKDRFCKTIPCELSNNVKREEHIAVFFICKGKSDKQEIRFLKRINAHVDLIYLQCSLFQSLIVLRPVHIKKWVYLSGLPIFVW